MSRELTIIVGFVLANAPIQGCLRQESQPKIASPQTAVLPSPEPTPSTPPKPTQAKPIEKKWPIKHTFATKSFEEKQGYELSVEYPQVAPARTPEVRGFNRWIKRKVLGHAARFRRLARAERRDKTRTRPPIEEGLELSFLIYYSDQRLISMRLTHRVMEAGQMHPINYYETLNYDFKKGRALHVHEVFKRGYLKRFSTFSREYLTQTFAMSSDGWMLRGTAPRAFNFPNWNIVPDGILLSFEDYQVNSHNFGQPEFVVPFAKLRRVLVDKGLAGRFLRKHGNISG